MVSVGTKLTNFQNGDDNDATDVNAELVNLYENDKLLAQSVTNLYDEETIFAKIKTFFAGLKTNSIVERTLGFGVFIAGMHFKNASTGGLGLDRMGLVVSYASASTITIGKGFASCTGTNSGLMENASPITVNLANLGANGRDAGSEAANTWYYLYLIGDNTGANPTAGIFSTVNESATGSITLPAGYNLKRQLPIAVRNNNTSDIIPFYVTDWGIRPTIQMMTNFSYVSGTLVDGDYILLNSGTAGSYTAIDLSSMMPPIAEVATLLLQAEGTHFQGTLQQTAPVTARYDCSLPQWCHQYLSVIAPAQSINYRRETGAGALTVELFSFTVTKVA